MPQLTNYKSPHLDSIPKKTDTLQNQNLVVVNPSRLLLKSLKSLLFERRSEPCRHGSQHIYIHVAAVRHISAMISDSLRREAHVRV